MNRMCATGSLPESPGAPPVTCTHRTLLRGSYPRTMTGPAATFRMALLPRESIQMMAGMRGSPSAPTATVPDHCDVQPTPTKVPGGTAASRTARWAAAPMADHHSAGSCSAPPPSRRCSATGSEAWATILPSVATTATLGPPGPRATARTTSCSGRGPLPTGVGLTGGSRLDHPHRRLTRRLPVVEHHDGAGAGSLRGGGGDGAGQDLAGDHPEHRLARLASHPA